MRCTHDPVLTNRCEMRQFKQCGIQTRGGVTEHNILVHQRHSYIGTTMASRILRAQLLAPLRSARKHPQRQSAAVRHALGFTNPSILNTSISRSRSLFTRNLLIQRSALEKQVHPGRRAKSTRLIHATPEASADALARNSDPNAVAVVIGASRGIGLAITQKLATRWNGRIVATCRDPSEAGALSALWQFMPDRFSVVQLDVEDETSVSLLTAFLTLLPSVHDTHLLSSACVPFRSRMLPNK